MKQNGPGLRYLKSRGGWRHYQRRVPSRFEGVDGRGLIQVALRTRWPDVTVGEDTLARSVSKLRKALGDDPKAPRFIETIPKRGYRLIALATYETALEIDPEAWGVLINMGDVLEISGRAREAVPFFERAYAAMDKAYKAEPARIRPWQARLGVITAQRKEQSQIFRQQSIGTAASCRSHRSIRTRREALRYANAQDHPACISLLLGALAQATFGVRF